MGCAQVGRHYPVALFELGPPAGNLLVEIPTDAAKLW